MRVYIWENGNINNFQLSNTEYPFECKQCAFVKERKKKQMRKQEMRILFFLAQSGRIYNSTTHGRFEYYQNKARL